jgi:ATP dependent DNA ligase C terminal region
MRAEFGAASPQLLVGRYSPISRPCRYPSARFGIFPNRVSADGATEDMKRRWLKPQVVAAIEFLEWAAEARLRHPKFVSLRNDKRAAHVIREGAQGEGIFRLRVIPLLGTLRKAERAATCPQKGPSPPSISQLYNSSAR